MKYILLLLFLFTSILVKSQVFNVEPYRMIGDTSRFFGTLDGSFNTTKNTKQITQFGINSYLDYKSKKLKTRKHILILVSTYTWLKTNSNGVTSNFLNDGFEHLRYNYALLDRLKTEAYIQYQFNMVMNIKQRTLLGVGLRYKIKDSKKIKLYVGSSIMNENDIIKFDNITEKIKYFKSSNYYTFTSYINHKFKISNTTYYQYNFQNSKHRIYSIAEIGIGITKNITYKMGFTLQYDNDPIFHAPTLVYSTSNKLSFTF